MDVHLRFRRPNEKEKELRITLVFPKDLDFE